MIRSVRGNPYCATAVVIGVIYVTDECPPTATNGSADGPG